LLVVSFPIMGDSLDALYVISYPASFVFVLQSGPPNVKDED
jgi:hypothetical protein